LSGREALLQERLEWERQKAAVANSRLRQEQEVQAEREDWKRERALLRREIERLGATMCTVEKQKEAAQMAHQETEARLSFDLQKVKDTQVKTVAKYEGALQEANGKAKDLELRCQDLERRCTQLFFASALSGKSQRSGTGTGPGAAGSSTSSTCSDSGDLLGSPAKEGKAEEVRRRRQERRRQHDTVGVITEDGTR
jgi:hypothetical protein